MSEYVTIKIPKELADEIDRLVKRRIRGYTSRSEFVKEAIRWYLREVSKKPLDS